MSLEVKMDKISDITNANLDHNRMVVAMIMSSLMANELDPQEQHNVLQEFKERIFEVGLLQKTSLQTPFLHAAFIIDHMRTKGGDAYTFFFKPEDFSIQHLLIIGTRGGSSLTHGLTLNQYSKSDLLNFFNGLKDLIKEVNVKNENTSSMYMAVIAVLLGFITEAENA